MSGLSACKESDCGRPVQQSFDEYAIDPAPFFNQEPLQ